MQMNETLVTIAVLEESNCQLAVDCDLDTALTIIALVSDDPANWEQACSVWPRYRTPPVCEFISSVPFATTERDNMMKLLSTAEAWVVIDFPNKRIFYGGQFEPIERDAVFAMVVDESGDQHWPLSIHLPPWWELHESAQLDDVMQDRMTPIHRPFVNRDVLFGVTFFKDIAIEH